MKVASYYDGEYRFVKTDNLRVNDISGPYTHTLTKKGFDTLQRVHLQAGDIIVTIIGATYDVIARSALVRPELLPAAINQNIALVRADRNKISPEYLVTYMNSKYGRMYLEYLARQMEQVNLNCQEIGQDAIVIPTIRVEKAIDGLVTEAYHRLAASKEKFDDAETTLLRIFHFDDYHTCSQQITTRSMHDILEAGRFDAEYYQPKYDQILEQLERISHGTVGTMCNIYDQNFTPDRSTSYDYIELANIGGNGIITGCTTDTGDNLPSRARRMVHTGNLLVPSIEGSLQSMALVSDTYDGALCSTGFFVLDAESMNSETLLVLFKSAPMQALLKRQCSGTILTGFDKDSLCSLPLPSISIETQREIQANVKRSLELHNEAMELLAQSKRAVELFIEQGEAAALDALH